MCDKYISVIMPVKNAEKYIENCIESVLNQTYSFFELIVLDDSDDNTFSIIDSYSDERIKLIHFKGNISEKINHGIIISKYDLISRMDADDYINPKKFEKQIEFLTKNPDVDIVGTNFFLIDSNNEILMEKKFPEYDESIKFLMPVITSVLHSSIMVKKILIVGAGGYNESLSYAEDTDLFLRLIDFAKFHNLQEPLYFYRINNNKFDASKVNLVYNLGADYLKNKKPDSSYTKDYQLALLEYYKGDVSKAKKLFLKLLIHSDFSKINILRYLLPSVLGNSIIWLFRKNGSLIAFNRFISRFLNYDTNNPDIK